MNVFDLRFDNIIYICKINIIKIDVVLFFKVI